MREQETSEFENTDKLYKIKQVFSWSFLAAVVTQSAAPPPLTHTAPRPPAQKETAEGTVNKEHLQNDSKCNFSFAENL